MAVKTKAGSNKGSKYTVSGANLAEIWADILKKGPTIKGKKVAAKTDTPYAADLKFDHKAEADDDEPGKFKGEFWIKSGTLNYSGAILMPNLKSDKDLSKAGKAEWKRFIGKLASHEAEHITKVGDRLKQVAAEMDALKAEAKGASENKAKAEAKKVFLKLFKESYDAKKIKAIIEKVHVDFDSSSNHGAKHGAKLNTAIP